MKRYVCTVATGLLLALVSTGTATAQGLPLPGQPGQVVSPGDQTVEEQENEAEVSHEQSNWNVASPPVAIAVLGKSEAENEQKNVNVSGTEVKQENEAEQTQSSAQQNSGTGCCAGQSQAGGQSFDGGDQTVEEQENEAEVEHEQKNVNVLSPPIAIAVLGHAEASNEQKNTNYSETDVEQENEVEQTQTSTQRSGGNCCNGQSQAGEQRVYGGDQKVEEQENEAEVSHEQSNWNVASPPVAIAVLGHAEASNEQKNTNYSKTEIEQENEVEQSQTSKQRQYGGKPSCSSSCEPKKQYPHGSSTKESPNGCCGSGGQSFDGGYQKVEEQENEAKVEHEQTNVNFLSPPIALGLLGKSEAENEQSNVNVSKTEIEQENEVEQSQTSEQSVVDMCKGLVYR